MEIPADLAAEMTRQGYTGLKLLPAVTRLYDGVVLTGQAGSSMVVVSAQQTGFGEWKWTGYGSRIAFKEGPLGRLADDAARHAVQGVASPTERAALGEISSVWVHGYLAGPYGERLSADEVDARILAEMDALKARVALLSDTRVRHIERVMDGEADVRRTGVQARAAKALGMSPAVLSRLLREADKRRAKWTANSSTD